MSTMAAPMTRAQLRLWGQLTCVPWEQREREWGEKGMAGRRGPAL